jgi:cytochrome c-type biogenesis protein CcmE
VYTGAVPDLFETGRHVYLRGELRGGVFVGEKDSLVTKCPSKYAPKQDSASPS